MPAVKITHMLSIIGPQEPPEELASLLGEMAEIAGVEIESVSFSSLGIEAQNAPIQIGLNFASEDAREKFDKHEGARKHYRRKLLQKCDCEGCKAELAKLDASVGEDVQSVPMSDKSIVMGAPSTLQ